MRHPLSLEAFTDWLATMPADETYQYCYNGSCAIAQYLRACGFRNAYVDPFNWSERPGGPTKRLPHHWNDIAWTEPWTFGAALSRARELQRTAG